jgi:hypothetical protein
LLLPLFIKISFLTVQTLWNLIVILQEFMQIILEHDTYDITCTCAHFIIELLIVSHPVQTLL